MRTYHFRMVNRDQKCSKCDAVLTSQGYCFECKLWTKGKPVYADTKIAKVLKESSTPSPKSPNLKTETQGSAQKTSSIGMPNMHEIRTEARTFGEGILDFRFRKYVSTQVASTLYVLATVIVVAYTLAFEFFALKSLLDTNQSFDLWVFIWPLIQALLIVVAVRVGLEAIVALVRIAENTAPKKSQD